LLPQAGKLLVGFIIHAPTVTAPILTRYLDDDRTWSILQSISDELAGHLDDGNGGDDTALPMALVVNSFGKIWQVEVGRDGGGAFLGSGWPEFVAANGFGVGWFLVLRHEGRGVLTVKAFDLTCCLKESRGLQPSTGNRSLIDWQFRMQILWIVPFFSYHFFKELGKFLLVFSLNSD
jgi:hypothetical protein